MFTRKAAAIAVAAALASGGGTLAGERIERALSKRINVNFVDTPFESAVKYVARSARFNVVIDRAEVAEGILRRPVNFRVNDIPAGEVVRWLTRIAGAHYEVGEKALVVSSKRAIFRKKVVLKIYDIHDLTWVAPDYPGPDIMPDVSYHAGAGGGGIFEMEEEARDLELTAVAIAQFIMSRVRPQDWDATIGTSIEERGGRLVIVALPEMHAEIERLLDHVRKQTSRMVAFRVRAVRAPERTVERAFATVGPGGALTPESLRLFENAVRIEPERLLASTRFTCFNAQRTHSWGGRRTSYLVDYEIAGDAYDPVVRTLLRGLRADVRPFVSDDGGSMLLELRLGYSDPSQDEAPEFRPVGPEESAQADEEVPAPGAVQQPRVALACLKTTVSLRSGGTVALAASAPEGADTDEIVFLVTATTVSF